MNTAAGPRNRSVIALNRFRQSYWMPIAVLLLGVVSASMLVWSMHINRHTRTNFARANSIMDMQILVATFHLWFEEHLNGDETEDMDAIWNYIDGGIALSQVIVAGGRGEHDLTVAPLEDSKYLVGIQSIQSLLKRLKAITVERFNDPARAGIGSELDQQFDDIYKQFSLKARELEDIVEYDQVANQEKSESIFKVTLAAWIIIVLTATAGLWDHENRRRAAEHALQTQADELQKHRFHLLELVEERTGELISANKGLHSEIAGHKRTLLKLEESRNRFEKLSLEFHALLDAIPDSLILFSPELKVLWANRGAAALMGMEAANMPGNHCVLHDSGPRSCPECAVLKSFKTGNIESAQITTVDGPVWDIRAFPIWDVTGSVSNVIEVATDITEKVALQAESMRKARLASLGELAAGVAHEINNPINGIINYAQILIDEGTPGDGHDIPEMIIREGTRIATIVRSLLSFARENRMEKAPSAVADIFSTAMALIGKQLQKEGIEIVEDISESGFQVIANSQQIEQVFLNLINNARYALDAKYPGAVGRKTIQITGKRIERDGRPFISVCFYDNGTGIPAGIIDKLMDPFFSTKPQDCGTGLGLSISHGIIDDHGGKLNIQSIEGEYTKVHLILPAV